MGRNPNITNVPAWPDDNVILYDGICVLCSGWMRFVLVHDKRELFRFTPIQSEYGRALAKALGIDPLNPDTNAAVMAGKAYRRSDAALTIVSRLPGWSWVHWLSIIPRPIRDLVYAAIARSRYQIF